MKRILNDKTERKLAYIMDFSNCTEYGYEKNDDNTITFHQQSPLGYAEKTFVSPNAFTRYINSIA